MLIAVTRLDEYEVARKNSFGIKQSCMRGEDFEGLITSIKQLVQNQFGPICEVPDECIIPVSAKAALEARKEMYNGGALPRSKDMKRMLFEFEHKAGREDLTIDELEKFSQVPLLEDRYACILFNVS